MRNADAFVARLEDIRDVATDLAQEATRMQTKLGGRAAAMAVFIKTEIDDVVRLLRKRDSDN